MLHDELRLLALSTICHRLLIVGNDDVKELLCCSNNAETSNAAPRDRGLGPHATDHQIDMKKSIDVSLNYRQRDPN